MSADVQIQNHDGRSTTRQAAAAPPSTVLHSGPSVLSFRHGSSFMLLALSAGAVNAGAFMACERFITHMTGIVTRIGLDASAWFLMLEYVGVLVFFVVGAMVSVTALQGRVIHGKRPLHALPLLAVAFILCVAAFAGHVGIFGPIGGHAEKPADFALLCILACAMGLMNATVASSTTYAVRTSHMTGPATDFGVHLATAWYATGEERRIALQLAALRGGKIASFIAGAALMVPWMNKAGYLSLFMPAFFVIVAAARSFNAIPNISAFKGASLVNLFQKGSS